MRPRVRMLLAVALCVFGEARATAQDVQRFHDTIVGANRRLKLAGYLVAQALPSVLAGKREDLPRLRNAVAEAGLALNTAIDEVTHLQIPQTPAAQDLYAVELRFLKVEQNLVKQDLAEMLTLAADEKLTPAEPQATPSRSDGAHEARGERRAGSSPAGL